MMKKFIECYAIVLVAVEVFLFFGGGLLFDFGRGYYTVGAACAFLLTVILYGFLRQSDQIDELEKRVRALEEREKKGD